MIYTLARGANGYNHRLHYSLYGGVEYFPDKTLVWKELLPMAAVPVVAISLLVAILNFHVPAISAPQHGSGRATNGASGSRSAATSSLVVSTPSSPTTTNSAKSSIDSPTHPASAGRNGSSTTPLNPISTLTGSGGGGDNGQGIISVPVGSGGGGGVTTPTPPTSSDGINASINTPATDASVDANVSQPTSPQAGVDVTVPLTNTTVTAQAGL